MSANTKPPKAKAERQLNRPWRTPSGIRIRPLKNDSGNYSYRVEVPESVAGKRVLKQFKTVEEAESYAGLMTVQRMNNGLAAFNLDEHQRSFARKAFDGLAHAGLADDVLPDAVAFYIRHHRPEGGDILVRDLVDRYLAQKQQEKLRPRSIQDLESRLGLFGQTFGDRLVKNLSTTELQEWLLDPTHSELTQRNYHTVIGGLFNHAVTRKYLAVNPLADVAKPRPEHKTPGILTLEQVQALLNAALGNPELELGWFIVCGLFLGVRTEELLKLKIADVRLTEGFLHIGPHIAKKRRIRNVPFAVEVKVKGKMKKLDPVTPWLSRLSAPANGMIAPPSCLNRFYKTLLNKAGIEDWPSNAMRHSFASYFYALTSNSAETCARLGHRRDDVLFEYYRALTTAQEGMAYFSLLPTMKNVIPIHHGRDESRLRAEPDRASVPAVRRRTAK